ncbi:phage protease [Deinococcus cellulosilyticus]|uniref:Uncharacterized protein n=1 Tax=Deinococcus cellulosilyticus (strain DSM 18568 / NBRC 106333 / KACC 11606 / 5516J-15) TaxID=1223518 RepID=A0A511NB25_DEIC1|nr:phage protease [Deinococcus cellulosilyticus]GEM50020.1 hypothetical protein DC3_56550 [Deinococcus cellulosilyticus NBRC 106333 = KACC 11606]
MNRRTALSLIPVGNSPPSEIRMFAYGETETTRGPFTLTPEGAQRIVTFWNDRGTDCSADYEHGMLNAILGTGQSVPSAAAFQLEAREDGLWAVNIRWTEKASAHIEAGEYRHYSPLFYFDPDTREITEFINFALTNVPAIKHQSPLMALSMSMPDLYAQIGAALKNEFGAQVSINTVFTDYVVFDVWLDGSGYKTFRTGYRLVGDQVQLDDTATEARQQFQDVPNGANMKKILLALSALSPALQMGNLATEDDAVRALGALSGFATSAQELTGASSLESALGVLSAWKQSHQQVATLSAQLETLQAKEKTRLIHQAIHVDKKLTPAQEEWAQKQSIEALTAFLATAPKIVGGNHDDNPSPHDHITAEQFAALSGLEKAAIYQQNPERYKQLSAEAKTLTSKGKA